MPARNRTYRPAAQSAAAARPSSDGGWRVVFPPAVGTHNPRSRETTRVTPFTHLHIVSFANYSLFTIHYSLGLSANNPVKLVDPNGEEMIDNPIFGTAGNLLGTDDKGWSGTPIVMNESDFKQGMSHSDAERKGTYLNEYGKGIKISDNDWNKIESHGGDKRLEPYIQNQSSGKIYFKPETTIGQYQNDGAYPLEAGKDLYMPVDGVATEYYSNRVMKIPDNKRIIVFSGGKVSFKGSSISRITPIYGWIYSDAIQSGDNSWDNLFRAACTTGGRCTGRGYDCDMMVKPLIYGFYFAKGLSSRIKNGK